MPKSPDEKTAKAANPKKPAARSDAAAKAAMTLDPMGGALKLKDLIDSVVTATGGKKSDVKKTVEATLSALGEAFATGKAMTVPPLGKLRVVKNNGTVLTLKLRLADAPKAAGLALADDGEDD